MSQTLTRVPMSKTLVPPHKLWRMTDEQRRRGPAATQVGATGQNVRANVARLRKARGWTTSKLAERMAAAGRPIPQSGVSRIELGARRVDVDDLTALAVVLGVSPSALLLPVGVESHDEVEVTGSTPVSASTAWHWADGKGPLRLPQGDGTTASGRALYEALAQYRLYGRPHWLTQWEDEEHDEIVRLREAEQEQETGGADG
jgi:transcriptional regulator with XRE-family HTH domain